MITRRVPYIMWCKDYLHCEEGEHRIKLFASPMEDFVEGIRYMVFLKTLVSVALELLAVGILFIIQKRAK